MASTDLTLEQKQECIKSLLKGYRKMTKSIIQELNDLGFEVEHGKKHVKITYQGKPFFFPSTASDIRTGINMSHILCRGMASLQQA